MKMHKVRKLAVFVLALAMAPPAISQPKLIIGIVADQMRYDYLAKYQHQFVENGFKRFYREGFSMNNHHFNYLPTFTGPGHASIFSGSVPGVHGIIGNSWYDKEAGRKWYCVEDPAVKPLGTTNEDSKRSPHKLLTTGMGDQLLFHNALSGKVIGISIKDRAAILPAGHRAHAAYWLDGESGDFVSSSYYMEDLPGWVRLFNGRNLPQKYLDQTWDLLLEESAYPEMDDAPYEEKYKGVEKSVLPYDMKKLMKESGSGVVGNTPWGNNLTVDMAIATIKGEELGQDKETDLLTVSFSTPDKMGHQFGPHSREIHDMYLRFDRELGRFFDYIDENIGMENVLIFFTADHGAADVPGFVGGNTGYYSNEDLEKSLNELYQEEFEVEDLLIGHTNFQLYLDHEKMDEAEIEVEDVVEVTRKNLRGDRSIYEVLDATELSDCQLPGRFCELITNGYHPQRGGDIYVLPQPGWIEDYYAGGGTTHGSPFSYDTHIPMFWLGWNIPNGQSWERTEIPDIAVTVAALLGMSSPNGATGRPMLPLLIDKK